jgi:DNA-directed RNA polymerase specialized sigma subunit
VRKGRSFRLRLLQFQATEGISAEEMQEELLDKAAKLKQKEREISVLKMMLDEEKFQHTAEIAGIGICHVHPLPSNGRHIGRRNARRAIRQSSKTKLKRT